MKSVPDSPLMQKRREMITPFYSFQGLNFPLIAAVSEYN